MLSATIFFIEQPLAASASIETTRTHGKRRMNPPGPAKKASPE